MPSIPALPEVERLVADLADEVARTPPSAKALWHIWGPATAGKSTALGLLGARLRQRGLVPIRIAPPARTLDAGALALVEAAAGLARGALIDGQLETIRSEKTTWSEKLTSVVSGRERRGSVSSFFATSRAPGPRRPPTTSTLQRARGRRAGGRRDLTAVTSAGDWRRRSSKGRRATDRSSETRGHA